MAGNGLFENPVPLRCNPDMRAALPHYRVVEAALEGANEPRAVYVTGELHTATTSSRT